MISAYQLLNYRRLLGTNGGSLWLWCCLAPASFWLTEVSPMGPAFGNAEKPLWEQPSSPLSHSQSNAHYLVYATAPQPPQPGSQAPPAPALAPDQLPQNNTLVALPIVAIENILSFMSYDEISQLRLVRPPGDPCRPLREPRSGEGPKGKSVPRGGSPWRAAAAAKAPSAPLPPQSLSWGWPAGLVQIPPLLGEWGRLPAGTWL